MSTKVAVIGGLGFLGAAVVRELLGRGDSVRVVDRAATQDACDKRFGRGCAESVAADMLDRHALAESLQRMDEVYHFGGRLGTSELDREIVAAIEANVIGAVNVFETAAAVGVPRVFYPSKPNVWLNSYTITKFAAEEFARLFNERGDVEIVSLRYFNAYGPEQATGPIRKIIPTFALQAMRGTPLGVYGDGQQTVDMIYSHDLARVTVDVMRGGPVPEPIDCGRGVALTVNEVAEAVNRHFGNRAGVEHLPMRDGEREGTQLVADVAPLRRLLGALEFSDWSESLAVTLDWYRRHAAA